MVPFLICLLTFVFAQHMNAFNPLFCRWLRFNQSLCDIAAIRWISILLIAYYRLSDRSRLRWGFIWSAFHEVEASWLTIRKSCCSICCFSVIQPLLLNRINLSICSACKISLRWLSISKRPSSGGRVLYCWYFHDSSCYLMPSFLNKLLQHFFCSISKFIFRWGP